MRLVGEDYMIQSLAPLGMGRRGFRKLCRQLGVPIIFAGKGACVDLFTFVSALKSVTRHGCRDFSLPGALERKKHLRRRVGPIDVEGVVAELVGGRAMFGMPTSAPLRTEISDACRRTTR